MNAGTDWKGLVWIKPLLQHSASLGFVLLIFVSMAEATADVVACDAQKPCDFGLYCILGQCKPNLFLNSAVIIMGITFLMVAIVFAIGRVLEHPRLIHWAETELWEVLGTAFILALYLGASGILDEVIGPAFYQTSIAYPGEPRYEISGTTCIIETRAAEPWTTVRSHVERYLNRLMGHVKDAIKGLGRLGVLAGMASSMMLTISIAPTVFYLPLFPAFGSVQQLFSFALYIIVSSAVQLQVQLAFVDMWDNMFTVLLPLGILFRAFPFTRTAGSALIAIAIGFTIILPISYLLIEDISDHYWCTHCNGVDLGFSTIEPDISLGTDIEAEIKDTLSDALQPGGAFQCIAFKIGVEALLLPVLAYLVTLNIARHLASILGAHIDFSTLVRVI